MKKNEILLKEIYLSSATGVNTISGILKRSDVSPLSDCLFSHMTSYCKISDRAVMLSENSENFKTVGTFSQTAVFAALFKPSDRRIAKIIINGCREGVSSLVDCINLCSSSDKDVLELALELLRTEEKTAEDMIRFL